MIKKWIKGPKMRDVVARVSSLKQPYADGDYELTVWWHNTGRAMGLPVFPMYAHSSKPAVETIKISKEALSTWLQADTAEELV